jgi:hypothetical protein
MTCGCQAIAPAEDAQRRADSLFNEPEGYPVFVYQVQPEPGTTMWLSEPFGWMYGSETQTQHICADILHEPLIRPGDSLQFSENVELVFDGNPVSVGPSHMATDIEIDLYDENDTLVASGSYSDVVCWNIDLSTGIHVVDLYVRTSTDEEYTYSWAFEITE